MSRQHSLSINNNAMLTTPLEQESDDILSEDNSSFIKYKSRLAVKGQAVPAIGYDIHDPNYPFGPAEKVSIPDMTTSGSQTRDLLLPSSMVPVIDDLVATLIKKEQRISALESYKADSQAIDEEFTPDFDLSMTLLKREKQHDCLSNSKNNCNVEHSALRPFILAIGSHKGGTGKTTTAINIAAEMSARNVRTLLINMDIQSHAEQALNAGNYFAKNVATIHGVLQGIAELDDAIIETPWHNLFIICSDPEFDSSYININGTALGHILSNTSIASRFDLVVLDMPSSFDIVSRNALSCADACLIPLLPHPAALDGVVKMLRSIERASVIRTTSLIEVGIVPVMVDMRTGLHRRILEQAAREFTNVFHPIRTDIKLAECFNYGKPIRYYSSKSRGAIDYRKLVDAIVNQWIDAFMIAIHQRRGVAQQVQA
ncbi:MAG: ParA family protein [Rhodospirillaceae bacterium]